MKVFDIRKLDDGELQKELQERQHELMNLRVEKVTSTLKNFSKMNLVRRDIARIQSVIREREIIKSLGN